MDLIDSLIKGGWLKTPAIIDAFKKIKRKDFISSDFKGFSDSNEALPIGFGQTISQPLTVAFMLELLQPKEGDKILDVGSGSGWTSALLAHIVGQEGRVVAVEIVPELKKMGEENAAKYNFVEKGIIQFVLGDGSKGYESQAPYDKILASAAGNDLPLAWKNQLKIDGRIVCPIKSSVWLFVKRSDKDWRSTEYPGFAFVPLLKT